MTEDNVKRLAELLGFEISKAAGFEECGINLYVSHGDVGISIKASRFHYCNPREDNLEAYETVEIALRKGVERFYCPSMKEIWKDDDVGAYLDEDTLIRVMCNVRLGNVKVINRVAVLE